MLTILSMLIGFLSSSAPSFMAFFQDKNDKAHELAMMELQLKNTNMIESYRADEIGVKEYSAIVQSAHRSQDSMVEKCSKWVMNFTASVRPVITYLFMISFIGFKVAAFCAAINPSLPWHQAVSFSQAMLQVWGEEETAIFSGIIAFWFGDRALTKRR